MHVTSRRSPWILVGLAVFVVAGAPVSAQPFGAWAVFNGTSGFVEIPHSSALNPGGALTIEAWVNVTLPAAGESCKSIVGKDFLQAYWVGICNTGSPLRPTLRSYVKGGGSVRNGGTIPNGEWTHIAVTYGGGSRRHYVNGELTLEVSDSGSLPSSGAALRIGSDVSWQFTPTGSIDDVRLWNVARTQSQIRAALNEVQGAQGGLVANWRLDGNPNDSVGGFDGAVIGPVAALTFPVTVGCAGSSNVLCLRDRFAVSGEWRVDASTEGDMGVVPFQTDESGLLHFFGESNWEVQIKVLDGCGLNDRYWVYYAASTTLFFRLEVLDQLRGVQKIYFNYPGEPAVAVTELDAFDTCP